MSLDSVSHAAALPCTDARAFDQARGIVGDCAGIPPELVPDLAQDPADIDPRDLDPHVEIEDPGMTDCWWKPGEADVRQEMYVDDEGRVGVRTVVDAGDGDDSVQVVRNEDGSADVTVNGETHHLTPEQARTMRVTGGAGDDTITVVDNRGLRAQVEDGFGGGKPRIEGGSGSDDFSGDLDGVEVVGSETPFNLDRDTANGEPI